MITAQGSGTQTNVVTTQNITNNITNSTTTITSTTLTFITKNINHLITKNTNLPTNIYITSITNNTTTILSQTTTTDHSKQTFTLNTEFVLLNVAIAGTFTFHVDAINNAAGDITEFRIY